MPAGTLWGSGWAQRLGAVLVTAEGHTCTANPLNPSNIDYFVTDRRLQDALGNIALRTHRPVRFYWKPKMEEIRIRTLRVKKLPSARVVGPLPKPPAWNDSITKTSQLPSKRGSKRRLCSMNKQAQGQTVTFRVGLPASS